MIIDIELLKKSIGVILDAEMEIYGSTIEVKDDLYWFIQRDELFNPDTTPKNLTLGSLEDDWKAIESVIKENEDPIGYMLVWASMVLRIVGERGLETKE